MERMKLWELIGKQAKIDGLEILNPIKDWTVRMWMEGEAVHICVEPPEKEPDINSLPQRAGARYFYT